MSDTVIKVDNLSKRYRIGTREGYQTFRETLADAAKAPFVRLRSALRKAHKAKEPDSQLPAPSSSLHAHSSEPPAPSSPLPAHTSMLSSRGDDHIWALKDVSFEVKRGEVVGIIGRNGAGKSTLLKILSKITEPTEGRVELKGRVGSLLEVGTGFHPELTGHENVYLYGAILGMDRWEVTRKFDEIVAFAELEKFIDTPVKRYSSGMYMRLAFAVAAHLEPEILLVDEVLAVGDAAFQNKCLWKMDAVSKQGRTVLFVSHSMASIAALCKSVVHLSFGRIHQMGESQNVIRNYMLSSVDIASTVFLKHIKKRRGTGEALITEALICGNDNKPRSTFSYGEDIYFDFTIEPIFGSPELIFVVWIKTVTGVPVLHLACHDDPSFENIKIQKKAFIRCILPNCLLYPGTYLVSFWMAPNHNMDTDFVIDVMQFRIDQHRLLNRGFDMKWQHALFHVKSKWYISKEPHR